MPTYQYLCTECGARLEQVQRFTDAPLTECTACQGRLRKVYSAVGVVFKGSGFYHNDSRAKPAANGERDSKDSGESKSDTSKTDKTTTEAKTDGKGKSEAGSKGDRPKEGRGDRRGESRGDRAPAGTSGGSSSSSSRDSSPSAPATPATKSA